MGYKKVNDDSLSAVAAAIKSKIGSQNSLTFPAGFVSAINSIIAGASLPDIPAAQEAKSYDIVSGRKAYNDQGQLLTGTLGEIYAEEGESYTAATDVDILVGKSAFNLDNQGNMEQVNGSIPIASDSGDAGTTYLRPGNEIKQWSGGKYYPSAHTANAVADTASITLDNSKLNQFLYLSASGISTQQNSDVTRRIFMSAFKVAALGGDIYRVKAGMVAKSNTKSFVIDNLPFQPAGFMVMRSMNGAPGTYTLVSVNYYSYSKYESTNNWIFGLGEGANSSGWSRHTHDAFTYGAQTANADDSDIGELTGCLRDHAVDVSLSSSLANYKYNGTYFYVIWGR